MTKYILSDLFVGDYPYNKKNRFKARPWAYLKYGFLGHEGNDWKTPVGVKVVCPFQEGIVLQAVKYAKGNPNPAYGRYVVLWDAKQKVAVWYCHLSQVNVSKGQTVKRGQVVGLTGNSGNTDGAHLHVNFCETDDRANRINKLNGFKGFLNILDPKLVSWKLK